MLWLMPYLVWMSVELLTDFDLCMHIQQLLLIIVHIYFRPGVVFIATLSCTGGVSRVKEWRT